MKNRIFHFCLFVMIIIIDQLTKVWARAELAINGPKRIIGRLLVFRYLENTGSAWGKFSDHTIGLFAFSLILVAVLFWIYLRTPNEKHYYPMQLIIICILAGALGNAFDRIYFRFVTDFIYIEIINFPTFNIADIFVSVPSIIFCILYLTKYKEESFSFVNPFKKKGK